MLGSLAATFAALETGFRLAGVSVGTVQINRATVRPSRNPRLLFELRPGSRVQAEVAYWINAAGLRGPEVQEQKAPGVRRLAVLGDSIAFGYWVAEGSAWPRQLEGLLNGRAGAPRVEVLNFAVPGYNLEQELESLRSRALGFEPDAVVVGFCLNDLEGLFSYEYGLTRRRADPARRPFTRALDAALGRSLLLSWVEYRLTERAARREYVKARNPLAPPDPQALEAQRRTLLANFEELRVLLASRGLPGLVAVFPTFDGPFRRYAHRDLHRLVVETAEASGLGAIDLVDCFAAYDFRVVRVDVVHPSPLGHRIAAHAVRDALCARGVLCDGAPNPAQPCTAYRAEEFPTVRGY